MSDDRPEQSEQPDECANWRSADRVERLASIGSLALTLRPYRVVQRYRGDRVGHDLLDAVWSDLWRLRRGDVSWPDDRRG